MYCMSLFFLSFTVSRLRRRNFWWSCPGIFHRFHPIYCSCSTLCVENEIFARCLVNVSSDSLSQSIVSGEEHLDLANYIPARGPQTVDLYSRYSLQHGRVSHYTASESVNSIMFKDIWKGTCCVQQTTGSKERSCERLKSVAKPALQSTNGGCYGKDVRERAWKGRRQM